MEVAVANEFEGMKGELSDVDWCENIPLPVLCVKKYRILISTKAFNCCLGDPWDFEIFTTLIHFLKGRIP